MTRRQLFILGCTLLVLLGLLASYLLSQATPYQKVLHHGPSPEARANPYLAAEQFLRLQGRQVQRADGLEILPNLPAPGNTLLLLGSRHNLTPRQSQKLLDWTRQGGHLIVVAERLWDDKKHSSGDLLLDPLGVQQIMSADLDDEADSTPAKTSETPAPEAEQAPADDSAKPADAAATASQQPEKPSGPDLTLLYLENEDAPAYIDFDTEYHLNDAQDRAHAWANSASSTHMLQLDEGDGLITVLTDSWIWQNGNIADYDNAWLLWYLTQDSQVTLLYRADRDDLLTLLRQHFPEALTALLLLLLAATWAVSLRQGPIQPVTNSGRRQLQEHLSSSADFLLRHAGQTSLLQILQRDILRRARIRHPGFDRLGVAEQWQILSRLSRLPPAAISKAMRPHPDKRLSASDFTRQVAHLQTLRNLL